jgi:PhnB protein
MQNALIQPYLFFGGRCQEALDFYTRALGAKVEMVLHYNESPEPPPPEMLQKGFETKVMHSAFRVGTTTLMGSDGCDDKSRFGGFSLAITVATEAEAKQIFGALSDGGQVQMPLTKTFWSPCYGMLTDRFGIGWMVMVPSDLPAQGGRP